MSTPTPGQQYSYPQPEQNRMNYVPPPKAAFGLALSSLIVGAFAFLIGWLPFVGIIAGATAVTLGIFGLAQKQSKAMGISGLTLGALAAITSLVITVAVMSAGGGLSSSAKEDIKPSQVDESEADAKSLSSKEPEAKKLPTKTKEPETEEKPSKSDKKASEPTKKAPEPAKKLGSVEDPYPQPYTATGFLGGEKYRLTSQIVDANAGALVSEGNMFNDAAPAGFKYVVVQISMEGLDPDGIEPSLAEFDLFLATSDGNRYSSEYVVLGDSMPPMSNGPTLYPGSSYTGYTSYIVPESAEAFLLYDNGNYVAL